MNSGAMYASRVFPFPLGDLVAYILMKRSDSRLSNTLRRMRLSAPLNLADRLASSYTVRPRGPAFTIRFATSLHRPANGESEMRFPYRLTARSCQKVT